ncbi:MAG: hypothetical protein ACPGJV_05035 [Bacteriovoracaceae bacterium]
MLISFLKSILATSVLGISLFSFASEKTISTVHPQLKLLVDEALSDLKLKDYQSQNLISIQGDPHHFEPPLSSIKKVLASKNLVAPPYEVFPWMKSIEIKRKRDSKLKSLGLEKSFNERLPKYRKLYPTMNDHQLAHFWLIPEVGCDFYNEIINFLNSSNKDSSTKCPYQIDTLKKRIKNILSNKNFTLILTHDAVYPLLSHFSWNHTLVIKESHHGNQVRATDLKTLYKLTHKKSSKPIVWILEKNMPLSARIRRRIKEADIILKVDSPGLKSKQASQTLNTTLIKLAKALETHGK